MCACVCVCVWGGGGGGGERKKTVGEWESKGEKGITDQVMCVARLITLPHTHYVTMYVHAPDIKHHSIILLNVTTRHFFVLHVQEM